MTGFETLTHARIRAAQGDLAGARRIASAIVERDPSDAAARGLLASLEGRADAVAVPEGAEALSEAVAASPGELREHFRERLGLARPSTSRERLSGWLDTVRRNRGRAS
jgi:hypothetical protein